MDNVYDLSPSLFERQSGTDYGTLLTDVVYYSTAAEDDKRVNILLPPGYDENGSYPVLYMIHGWEAITPLICMKAPICICCTAIWFATDLPNQ